MSPKFGTSGLRGLVTELTDRLITDHVAAFLSVCDVGSRVYLGHDLRASSPRIAETVARTITRSGRECVSCGAVPTPALALAARDDGAIMVTGSHIPADRNGLKFYSRSGEITKRDEAAIVAALGRPAPADPAAGQVVEDKAVGARFVDRYRVAFGKGALSGRRIGLYSHSAVGRDLLADCLRGLGAEVIELGRSETFIPVDTEAVDAGTRDMLSGWVRDHSLDAIASTDGDSDRPMLADEAGRVIPGDILGQITAELVQADCVVTPISSNSAVLAKGFSSVVQTRIGSPFVIAAMEEAGGRVIGYEANGGTILGYDAELPGGRLAALATRDSFLPLIAPLVAAAGGPLSARVAAEPPRFTAADRLEGIDTSLSAALLDQLASGERDRFLRFTGAEVREENDLDGRRFYLTDGSVVHLRPSGNAPELRVYTEASESERAQELLIGAFAAVRAELDRMSR